MEKMWNHFWETGKVEDYLNYCEKSKTAYGGTNTLPVIGDRESYVDGKKSEGHEEGMKGTWDSQSL